MARSQQPEPNAQKPFPGAGVGQGEGPPNYKPRGRGSREGDPKADSVMPGREYGAGGQVDDGPDISTGVGSGTGGG